MRVCERGENIRIVGESWPYGRISGDGELRKTWEYIAAAKRKKTIS